MCTEKYKVCTEYSMSNREKDGKKIRVYLNVEIQNNPYPGYSIITRGYAYVSRIVSE